MSATTWSIVLICAVSILVLAASFLRLPDLGVALSLILIGITTWLSPGGLEQLGFVTVENWPRLIVLSILTGILISIGALILVEPVSERLTGKSHNLQLVEPIRGNWKLLMRLIILVWLLVAPLEEVLFRGFLMNELVDVLGTSALALAVNLLLSSALFGLAHLYQGISGVLSTAVVGMVIGVIFIGAGFNIWPVIITHASIDTVSLLILFANKDRMLKNLLIKSNDVQDDADEGNSYSSDSRVG